MRPLRVAHVATGNVGRLVLRHLIEDPRFELVALSVSTADKVGVDAGELAGIGMQTGVLAELGLDGVLGSRAECVTYCAMGDNRLDDAIEDCRLLLEAGLNVVGSSPGSLIHPWGVLPHTWISPIEDAARDGRASVFITGIDPGFATDLVPLAIASTCRSIEQIRCLEIADYATYDGATVMFDVMGFGGDLDIVPFLFKPGILGAAWGPAIRQLAAAFDLKIDEIRESVVRLPAPEAFEIAAGSIPAGGVAAVRFEITGVVAGRDAIVIEHITRLRPDLGPEWRQPAQEGGSYRLEILGEPSYVVDICPTSRDGDHNYAAILAAAGRIVNSIPDVVSAAPGLLTCLDLPLRAGNGFAVAAANA